MEAKNLPNSGVNTPVGEVAENCSSKFSSFSTLNLQAPEEPSEPEGGSTISKLQRTVCNKIKNVMPSADIEMEKRVMLFPVDIYIELRSSILCVEVNGPDHFLKDGAGKLYELAKHRFSNYVIKEVLGYQFLSINYQEVNREKSLKKFINDAKKLLNAEG